MLTYLPRFLPILTQGPPLVIPLWQVLLLMLISCTALWLERPRLVLAFLYVFMVHWVFVENSVVSIQAMTLHSLFISLAFVLTGFVGVSALVYQSLTHRS
ncbi:MAG: hypothetical protein GXP31_15615 [Kiritimatiellaeota bacterium]|nr:hypothetical protein [Kiritimatiellota bacterium]